MSLYQDSDKSILNENSLSKPDWMATEIFYEELKSFCIKSSILISYYDHRIMINL